MSQICRSQIPYGFKESLATNTACEGFSFSIVLFCSVLVYAMNELHSWMFPANAVTCD